MECASDKCQSLPADDGKAYQYLCLRYSWGGGGALDADVPHKGAIIQIRPSNLVGAFGTEARTEVGGRPIGDKDKVVPRIEPVEGGKDRCPLSGKGEGTNVKCVGRGGRHWSKILLDRTEFRIIAVPVTPSF